MTFDTWKGSGMEKDKVEQAARADRIERDYARYFGNGNSRQQSEFESKGYFVKYSAYGREAVTYASNTGR